MDHGQNGGKFGLRNGIGAVQPTNLDFADDAVIVADTTEVLLEAIEGARKQSR